MAYKRLGDILVNANIITNDELNEYLAIGKSKNQRLGEVLIASNVITQSQLIDLLKYQLGVEYVDLNQTTIPASMVSLFPKTLAKKYNCIPVKVVDENLYLAMSDPLNFLAIEEINAATKKHVIPLISTTQAIDKAIVLLYGNEGLSQAINEMQKTLSLNGYDETVLTIKETDDAAPAIRLVNSIIERGLSENASDIHIEPNENAVVIRMRIDGLLHHILDIPSSLKNAVISRIKIMSNLDISEHRIPQDGRTSIYIKEKSIDLRISVLPTIYGEKIVIRFLEKSEELLSKKGIGLQKHLIPVYENLIHNANGVILIAGPTGSGKSTTMYTMICELNDEYHNLVTLEDPIEYNIANVNQVQINEKVGLTFASGLRSILRQDPDIISIGEIRDGETAQIAMRAAITGHLILSTIHTNDAISTIDRLIDIGVEEYLISAGVKGIISQRLVRKICPYCKEEYEPAKEDLDYMGYFSIDANQHKFYRGKGCPECKNTGYKGRTGVFEILTLNNDIKQQIKDKTGSKALNEAIIRSGFIPMKNDVANLIDAGITTIEEAKRILHTTD